MSEHSKKEILSVLKNIPQISVSTRNGPGIRTRMMHFVNDDDFNIYLASLKGDPKTIQLTQNPHISLLALKYEGDFPAATEIEITGSAEFLQDESLRKKWFIEESSKSPIVKYMVDTGNTNKLELIKVQPEIVKYRIAQEIVQGIPPTVINFPNNKRSDNDINQIKSKIKTWAAEVRLPFLTATLIPVVLGTSIAGATFNVFNPLFFVLALIGAAAFHMSANTLNDYFDHKSGTDEMNTEFVRPFSGGSRMIQLGLLSPAEVLTGGLFLLFIGSSIGIFFIYYVGNFIAILLLIGLVSAFFYTAPPLNLASRGVGEIFIGLNFGFLMTIGSFYVQTQTINLESMVAATPVALLIAAVLYINEFPDYAADKAAGKWHLVVRLGKSKASLGFVFIIIATYASIIFSVAFSIVPVYMLIALMTMPLAILAARFALTYHSETPNLIPANAATINIHLLTGLMLSIGYILSMLSSNQLLITSIITATGGLIVARTYLKISSIPIITNGVNHAVSSNTNQP